MTIVAMIFGMSPRPQQPPLRLQQCPNLPLGSSALTATVQTSPGRSSAKIVAHSYHSHKRPHRPPLLPGNRNPLHQLISLPPPPLNNRLIRRLHLHRPLQQ